MLLEIIVKHLLEHPLICEIKRSPERIDNSGYSYNSDVWSLGINMIEMVTGKNPYPLNASPLELVNWIVQKPTPTLSSGLGCSAQLIDFTNLWYNN